MSSDSLWARIVEGDGTALIGLKAPDTNRGVYRERILVSADQQRHAEEQIAALPGVFITSRHEKLPFVRAKIPNLTTLDELRRLRVVDYVEPAVARRGFHLSSGCGLDPYNSGFVSSSTGDLVPVALAYMGIPQAWHRASGDNITIGVIDTGIYASSEQMTSAFTTGMSNDRWVDYRYVSPYTSGLIGDGDCSHGNRTASAATAPRDGSGPVGVAWKSNLFSVRFDGDVVSIDIEPTVDAIYLASANSNVVAMAWGSTDWYNSIADAITNSYSTTPALFIGAAGTTSCDNPFRDNVVFPAEMQEVVAVTATGALSADCEAHYGPEVLLTAAVRTAVAGRGTEVVDLRASSNATVLISGAAAVVWSYLGGWNAVTRDQVVQRLVETADYYPNKDSKLGYGEINLARAVGAMWYVDVGGCHDEDERCTFRYKLDQCTVQTYDITYKGGSGPYSYQWDDGTTGSSTTLEICPEPYEEVAYSLSGGVRDHSDGNYVSRTLEIYVTHSNPDYACSTCAK